MNYEDPVALAAAVASRRRPLLLGLDIDGVLAPLVSHADDAVLLDGIAEALDALLAEPDVAIAAVSGRALSSIKTFGLPAGIRLVGSHGMEDDDHPMPDLDSTEAACLDRLHEMAHDEAQRAGEGAWVEHKTASVALHVIKADADAGAAALERLASAAAVVPGATVKPGRAVLELFAREASKGSAMVALAEETKAVTTVFVGDDITDEEAFAALSDHDISIKVGDAPTIATFRLVDPPAVLAWLRALTMTPPTSAGASAPESAPG